MIENTVLAKIIGCGAVATGSVGGCYYAHTTGAFNFEYSSGEKEDEKDYLIVKSVVATKDALQENLYDINLLGQVTKNFKCKFDNNTNEDKDCEIYKLTDKEKQLSKITIKNNDFLTSSNIKKDGNFFKLVVKNKEMLGAVTTWEDTTKQISLLQKDVTTGAKEFTKLIPVFKVEKGKIIDGKKSSLFTKVDGTSPTQPSEEITNSSKNYQCQDVTTQFNCDISEITVDTTKKTVVLKNATTENTLTKANMIASNKQFEIKAIKSYFENIDYSKSKIDVIATNPTDSQKYSVLTPQFVSAEQKIISGKDNFVFAVAASTINNSDTADGTWTNYSKCLIGDDTEKKDCAVYKFSSPQTNTTDVKALDFSSNLAKATEDSHISANNYHIIKFNPAFKNFLNSDQTIKLVSSSDKTGQKEYSFTVKANMYLDAQESNETLTINSVYIFENTVA